MKNLQIWQFFLKKNSYKNGDIVICGISQISSIINDVTAILVLCSRGLDIAARRQARALYETVNVFILTSHDRNFRTEYLTTTDSKSSNHFWHKFLSKDKDVEAIKKQVAEFWLKGKWYDEVMLRMRKELGRSTHPSLFDNVQQSKILLKRLSPDGWGEVFLTTESVLYFTLFQCWNCIAIGLSGVNKKGSDLWDLILEASSESGDIESLKKWNKVMIVLCPLVSDKLKEEAAAVRKRSPQ